MYLYLLSLPAHHLAPSQPLAAWLRLEGSTHAHEMPCAGLQTFPEVAEVFSHIRRSSASDHLDACKACSCQGLGKNISQIAQRVKVWDVSMAYNGCVHLYQWLNGCRHMPQACQDKTCRATSPTSPGTEPPRLGSRPLEPSAVSHLAALASPC